MNYLDIIFVVLLLGGTILGIISGVFWQVIRIIILVVSAVLSIYVHQPIVGHLFSPDSEQSITKIIIFLFIFIGIYLILFLITYLIERGIKQAKSPGIISRIFGGLLGLVKTGLICGVILMGITFYPVRSLNQAVRASFISPYLLVYSSKVICIMPTKNKQQITYSVDKLLKRN